MDIAPKIAAKVFVSYARQDCSTLAEELVTALELLQFDGYLDRSDIAAGEDWEHRLDALIRQADTVVFVLSPRSVCLVVMSPIESDACCNYRQHRQAG